VLHENEVRRSQDDLKQPVSQLDWLSAIANVRLGFRWMSAYEAAAFTVRCASVRRSMDSAMASMAPSVEAPKPSHDRGQEAVGS
jgi:hypothetical protein